MTDSRALVAIDAGIGPMDVLATVTADPNTMEVVGQRVMDGWTLKQIARAWQVPVVAFIAWIMADAERKAGYEAALRVRADELALETVTIADEQQCVVKANGQEFDPDVQRDSLRVKTRMQLAQLLDRERFGEKRATTPTARVIVDRTCSGVQDTVAVEVSGG